MISVKMIELVKNSSVIRAAFEEGKKMAAEFGADNVYDFSLGNPYEAPPASLKNHAIEILTGESEMLVHGYMNNSGYEDVRNMISASINRKYGTSFSGNNILMTVGAAGAINVVLKTLLNPGDEVIMFAPFFGEYTNYISNHDGVQIVISPDYDGFKMKFDEFEAKISNKTKAVIINSPNNPTGVIYSEDDIKRLADILSQKQKEFGEPIYLISDEPYREVLFGDFDVPYVPKYYHNTFVCYSYSKTLSIPGERIGYIAYPPEMDGFSEISGAMNVANRILGYVNAPSLFQRVVAKCVDETSDFSLYKKNKDVLYRELTRLGFECIEPAGAFYMFPKCPVKDDKKFTEDAKKFRLLLVPGTTFACPGYFRIAFCVSHETVLNSLDSFKKLIELY